MSYTFDINGKTISLKNIMYITSLLALKNGGNKFSIVYKRPIDPKTGTYDDSESEIEFQYKDEALAKAEREDLIKFWEISLQ